MDNGGWNERDSIDWTIKNLRESNEELRKENETLNIINKTLFNIIQENKFEQENKKLRQDLFSLTRKIEELEGKCENNRKIDDFERHLLDYIYTKAEIINANRNFQGFHCFVIPGTFYYNCVFDDTIKDYFISKGVEEE